MPDTLEIPPGALLEGLFVPRERKAPTHSKSGRPSAATAELQGSDA